MNKCIIKRKRVYEIISTQILNHFTFISFLFQPYIEIVLGKKFTNADGFLGLHDPEAAELRKWVDFVYSQVKLSYDLDCFK